MLEGNKDPSARNAMNCKPKFYTFCIVTGNFFNQLLNRKRSEGRGRELRLSDRFSTFSRMDGTYFFLVGTVSFGKIG